MWQVKAQVNRAGKNNAKENEYSKYLEIIQ